MYFYQNLLIEDSKLRFFTNQIYFVHLISSHIMFNLWRARQFASLSSTFLERIFSASNIFLGFEALPSIIFRPIFYAFLIELESYLVKILFLLNFVQVNRPCPVLLRASRPYHCGSRLAPNFWYNSGQASEKPCQCRRSVSKWPSFQSLV